MKTFIKISLCCFTFFLCLSAEAQEKADNLAEQKALYEKYDKIIEDYNAQQVMQLPESQRNSILIAKAKKMILRYDTPDYFGLYEVPKIEYVKLKKGFYMPRDKNTWGKMAYRINFYKTPDKKELKHIIYFLEDSGKMKIKTNITFITQ